MLITKTVTGMKDIMPKEEELRQYLLTILRKTYTEFGFMGMETPHIEHLKNLTSDQGWENEKLIFKILKRGEKLKEAFDEKKYENICDEALRFDLTVPLCRYYAEHRNDLPQPFKAMQIGNVFRADKPQKGRFRSFLQCDIDELGDGTNIAEIDILLATSTFLKRIGFDQYGFKFAINDRRILKAAQNYAGFSEEDFEKVCITLDKFDKIGFSGVKEELLQYGYDKVKVEKYLKLIDNNDGSLSSLKKLGDELKEYLEIDVLNSLVEIISTVSELNNVKIDFAPTLVRGMGYYTGPIFEIQSDKLSSSFGGGGRYDKMVGDFIGTNVPATGLSIGFERLITILMENNYEIPSETKKIAFLFNKDVNEEIKKEAFKEALELRQKGHVVYTSPKNKNIKFQKEALSKEGFNEFKEFG
ncbi:MAG: histidine--tRNA ligase [Eubacteriales bacterium]|nr:histidine--tRNA ligase [Eubacteriales bacterium]